MFRGLGRILLIGILAVGFLPLQGKAQDQNLPDPEVVLVDGPGQQVVDMLQTRLTNIVRGVNQYQSRTGDQQSLASFVNDDYIAGDDGSYGIQELQALCDTTGMAFKKEVIETSVLEMSDGIYEVRRLNVEVETHGNEKANKTQELVLNFSPEGIMNGARFAMDMTRYDEILMESKSLEDDFRRKQIIGYLERFRTAYNKKDVDFIEQQFSDNALIITGTRVQVAEDQKELPMNQEKVPEEKFKLIKRSKSEYISNLRNNIFKNNSFINVEFEGINIYQHPDYDEVYGVNLFQKWSSSSYSDEGYLFLMIDYENEDKPLIYVRAWQPEPFENGQLIDMDMFELVK
jgi:hypothetical protein